MICATFPPDLTIRGGAEAVDSWSINTLSICRAAHLIYAIFRVSRGLIGVIAQAGYGIAIGTVG